MGKIMEEKNKGTKRPKRNGTRPAKNSGKKGIAKNTYDNFCKEYHTLLGVEYNIPFSQIIHANE